MSQKVQEFQTVINFPSRRNQARAAAPTVAETASEVKRLDLVSVFHYSLVLFCFCLLVPSLILIHHLGTEKMTICITFSTNVELLLDVTDMK